MQSFSRKIKKGLPFIVIVQKATGCSQVIFIIFNASGCSSPARLPHSPPYRKQWRDVCWGPPAFGICKTVSHCPFCLKFIRWEIVYSANSEPLSLKTYAPDPYIGPLIERNDSEMLSSPIKRTQIWIWITDWFPNQYSLTLKSEVFLNPGFKIVIFFSHSPPQLLPEKRRQNYFAENQKWRKGVLSKRGSKCFVYLSEPRDMYSQQQFTAFAE